MNKLVNFAIVAGLIGFVAWSHNKSSEQAAAARADAVSTYQLTSQQATVYYGCVGALSRKRLKNGGATESFCGCFAKTAASDDNGVKYSVGILQQTADGFAADKYREARLRDPQYFSTFIRTAKVAVECAKDQQHTFASMDERNSWCSAKQERSADRRCRPL